MDIIAKCKYCGSHPVIDFSNFTGLIEVYCRCKKNVFVGYGNTQQEAVVEWNRENEISTEPLYEGCESA